jgi:hypothetical protein
MIDTDIATRRGSARSAPLPRRGRALTLRASFGVLLLLAAVPSVARADDIAARNLAEQMFSDGKKLMAEGKFDEACPKLAESQRLDPGGGTILNLAVCHENQGRFASAWSEFREAVGLARTDGRHDREQLAQEHLAAIEPKVSHLTFAVDPKAAVPGLTIKLDGQTVGPAAWGSSLPVDPGEHNVTASAPGKSDQRSTVQVAGLADAKTVTVHPLEDAPAPSAPAMASDSTSEATSSGPSSGKRIAGFVVGGVGLAALGVGAVFGVEALQKRHDSDATCNGSLCSTAAGVSLNDDAKRFANFADVGIGVGVVGLVVGTYLVVTGAGSKPVPAATASRVKVLPAIGAGTSTVQLSGTW